jgi:NitT/TauT family transport system ATP-binding protein
MGRPTENGESSRSQRGLHPRVRGGESGGSSETPPSSERGAAIDIDRVTKTFPIDGKRAVQALTEISLGIRPGEFVSVVGPSGCGKSTLMLMTAGLLGPTAGTIRVAGRALVSPLTDVGIVFQDDLLLEFRSGLDNVLLQGRIRHLDMAEVRPRAQRLLGQLGVAHAADRYPRQLSGGMRQRVSLARALVHAPSVLLMDEPFGALDALTRLQVRADLERLWLSERQTVLFITHSIEEAVGLSDRVVVMSPSPGRIVREVTIDLPRPRPLALGEAPALSDHVQAIYRIFEEMGVLHGKGTG